MKKLFSYLICLLNFYSKDLQAPTSKTTTIDQLLSLDKNVTLKKIVKILSEIGYTNLWVENYNSMKEINYLKDFRQKTGFKEESEEETFFSWVLRTCLEN